MIHHLVGRVLIRARVSLSIVAALASAAVARSAAAETNIGLVVDNGSDVVIAFDVDSGEVFGAARIPDGLTSGDCTISTSPTETRAFVTDFNSQLWSFDLTKSPPESSGPIPISNPGEDVALSPDRSFAVVCDGSNFAPVSVIDVVDGVEVDAFDLGSDCNSVDVCSDGSVLVTSTSGNVRRLLLDGSGTLSDTGEIMFVDFPVNVACAPGAASGIVALPDSGAIQSFTVPGLAPVDVRTAFIVQTVIVAPDGTRAFARSALGGIDAFEYDEMTGMFGAQLFSVPVTEVSTFYGIDQLAVHPDGSRLYVPSSGEGVQVLDAASGATLSTIETSGLELTGVCVASAEVTPPPLPAPPNDDFADALVISGLPYSDFENTFHATTEPTDPDCAGDGHSVWYQFTAPASVPIVIDTEGSSYATNLSVYTGSPPSLVTIVCNDFPQSQIEFDAVEGTTYFIAVSSGDASGGFLQFTARERFSITLSDLTGTVSNVDGTATLTGVFTCSSPGFVEVPFIHLRQKANKTIIENITSTFISSCDGPTPWSVKIAASSPFKSGLATATLNFFGCDANECDDGSETATVHLKGSKGK